MKKNVRSSVASFNLGWISGHCIVCSVFRNYIMKCFVVHKFKICLVKCPEKRFEIEFVTWGCTSSIANVQVISRCSLSGYSKKHRF